jgi:gamma-glutamyl phosphate reductase
MDIKSQVREIAKNAKTAAAALSRSSSDKKNQALEEMAKELLRQSAYLREENAKDLEYARRAGLSDAMITASPSMRKPSAPWRADSSKLRRCPIPWAR